MEELKKDIRQFYEAILHTEDLSFPYNNFPLDAVKMHRDIA